MYAQNKTTVVVDFAIYINLWSINKNNYVYVLMIKI